MQIVAMESRRDTRGIMSVMEMIMESNEDP